jgi:PAS domain S-box-containing protein
MRDPHTTCGWPLRERRRVRNFFGGAGAGLAVCQVLDALPSALYMTDAGGRITYYNEAAATLWGQRPELGRTTWCGSWKLHSPDGWPLPHDQCPMATALRERLPIHGAELVAQRPDGTTIPFISYPTPLYDASGVLVGAGTCWWISQIASAPSSLCSGLLRS